MNKIATFLLIFFLNSVLTFIYIDILIGTFNVQEIWDSYENNSFPFLYDGMMYNLQAGTLSIQDAINRLFEGTTTIHVAVLGYFFESETLISSLLVNSIFVAITFSLFNIRSKYVFYLYLILAPFFVFYSVFWTKEIIYTLALALFLRFIVTNSKVVFYSSIVVTLLSRPQFLPLQLIALVAKNVSHKRFVIYTLIITAFSPIWLVLTPASYTAISEFIYDSAGGQGVSVYTDYLKTNIPILSIVGYLASLLKLYYEPLSSIINSSGNSIYAWIEFYLQIVLFINLIKTRFSVFECKILFNLFFLSSIFVASLPFTHFRYLLPLMVVMIAYIMAASFKSEESKIIESHKNVLPPTY